MPGAGKGQLEDAQQIEALGKALARMAVEGADLGQQLDLDGQQGREVRRRQQETAGPRHPALGAGRGAIEVDAGADQVFARPQVAMQQWLGCGPFGPGHDAPRRQFDAGGDDLMHPLGDDLVDAVLRRAGGHVPQAGTA
ncbi:hypothetical protein D3C81_1496240 [compost metagenome]